VLENFIAVPERARDCAANQRLNRITLRAVPRAENDPKGVDEILLRSGTMPNLGMICDLIFYALYQMFKPHEAMWIQ
jgi:hypothetical protein